MCIRDSFLGGCWQKGSQDCSLAFLYWLGIALHPWPFVSDIAIFVLKMVVKHQLTNHREIKWSGKMGVGTVWPWKWDRNWNEVMGMCGSHNTIHTPWRLLAIAFLVPSCYDEPVISSSAYKVCVFYLFAWASLSELALSSDREHLSYGVCLEVRGEIIRTVLCCTQS